MGGKENEDYFLLLWKYMIHAVKSSQDSAV